jgi:hypothetical protein
MRRLRVLFVAWAMVLALGPVVRATAAGLPLPPPVSVGPVEVKAVRWLAEGYNPVWGPNGSFFIVSRWKGGFFRYPSDGSKETRLGKNTEGFCDLSPDGKSVLYCQTRKVTVGKPPARDEIRVPSGVWLMRSDGTGRRAVSKSAAYAKWSPDGRYFVCQHEPQPHRVEGPAFVYDRTGKLVRRIEYAMGPPSWSGDGQYLAYVGKAGKIYLARGDGSSPKVADQPTGGEPYAQLWWSPKGHNLLYAWKKQRYGIPSGPLCHLAPGRTPIEIRDAFWEVMWSPTGDRAVATARQGRLTVFSFPEGKDPEVLLSRAPGGLDAPSTFWSGDGRYLFYTAPDGLWLAAAESEEDRPLGRPNIMIPLAAIPGGYVICAEKTKRGRPWLLNGSGDEAAPLVDSEELRWLDYGHWGFAGSGRGMVVNTHNRLLLFQITRRT